MGSVNTPVQGGRTALEEGARGAPDASRTVPQHLAIIMDGNGRWARQRGLPRVLGHRAGMKAVKRTITNCDQLGIKYLTLYAFSSENWRRSEREVGILMKLLVEYMSRELRALGEQQVRVRVIGRIHTLPEAVQGILQRAVEDTAGNEGLQLNLALSYSGRWDLVDAMQAMARQVAQGVLAPEAIDEDTIAAHLSTRGVPDPDLLIRTSGEMRISNFLLWEISYAELYVTKVFWPDFDRSHLEEAMADYRQRERRFGG